eukprot:7047885-Prymnesium_polylepis.1
MTSSSCASRCERPGAAGSSGERSRRGEQSVGAVGSCSALGRAIGREIGSRREPRRDLGWVGLGCGVGGWCWRRAVWREGSGDAIGVAGSRQVTAGNAHRPKNGCRLVVGRFDWLAKRKCVRRVCGVCAACVGVTCVRSPSDAGSENAGYGLPWSGVRGRPTRPAGHAPHTTRAAVGRRAAARGASD